MNSSGIYCIRHHNMNSSALRSNIPNSFRTRNGCLPTRSTHHKHHSPLCYVTDGRRRLRIHAIDQEQYGATAAQARQRTRYHKRHLFIARKAKRAYFSTRLQPSGRYLSLPHPRALTLVLRRDAKIRCDIMMGTWAITPASSRGYLTRKRIKSWATERFPVPRSPRSQLTSAEIKPIDFDICEGDHGGQDITCFAFDDDAIPIVI